ncbi:MAG: [Fe-Fe] hydrogenase large subunit C-terminal domain-containing protein [Paeniclostridium sp.]
MVQIAPAVRVGISEEFGLEPGAISTGKVVATLKALDLIMYSILILCRLNYNGRS